MTSFSCRCRAHLPKHTQQPSITSVHVHFSGRCLAADWTLRLLASRERRVAAGKHLKKKKEGLGKQSEQDKEDAWHPRNMETENTSFVLVVKEKRRVKNSGTGLLCADTKDTRTKMRAC